MKAKSVRSIAALVGVAIGLHASAYAGPGAQPETQKSEVREKKSATVAFGGTVRTRNAPATEKASAKPGPKLTRISGPRGDHFIYRW